MAWGRLDDRANSSSKLLALSDPAWRMWGCGLIYCQDALTDGFIPADVIHTFGVKARNKRAVADELCRAIVPGKGPLWHQVEGGYQVHDYLNWNDSKAEILAGREGGRKRTARWRGGDVLRDAVSDASQPPYGNASRDAHTVVVDLRKKEMGESESPELLLERFETFWSRYPRQQGREPAWKAWLDIGPNEAHASEIVAGVERYRLTKTVTEALASGDCSYVTLPKNWLRETRWLDAEKPNAGRSLVLKVCQNRHNPPCQDPAECSLRYLRELQAPPSAAEVCA